MTGAIAIPESSRELLTRGGILRNVVNPSEFANENMGWASLFLTQSHTPPPTPGAVPYSSQYTLRLCGAITMEDCAHHQSQQSTRRRNPVTTLSIIRSLVRKDRVSGFLSHLLLQTEYYIMPISYT